MSFKPNLRSISIFDCTRLDTKLPNCFFCQLLSGRFTQPAFKHLIVYYCRSDRVAGKTSWTAAACKLVCLQFNLFSFSSDFRLKTCILVPNLWCFYSFFFANRDIGFIWVFFCLPSIGYFCTHTIYKVSFTIMIDLQNSLNIWHQIQLVVSHIPFLLLNLSFLLIYSREYF